MGRRHYGRLHLSLEISMRGFGSLRIGKKGLQVGEGCGLRCKAIRLPSVRSTALRDEVKSFKLEGMI